MTPKPCGYAAGCIGPEAHEMYRRCAPEVINLGGVHKDEPECHAFVPAWMWLASTEKLQREAFASPVDDIRANPGMLTHELTWNLLATIIEIAEAFGEFAWKPWAKDKPFVRREKLITELVDASHFIANALVDLGVTDAEWEAAYQTKQQVNRDRQASGYLVEHKDAYIP